MCPGDWFWGVSRLEGVLQQGLEADTWDVFKQEGAVLVYNAENMISTCKLVISVRKFNFNKGLVLRPKDRQSIIIICVIIVFHGDCCCCRRRRWVKESSSAHNYRANLFTQDTRVDFLFFLLNFAVTVSNAVKKCFKRHHSIWEACIFSLNQKWSQVVKVKDDNAEKFIKIL